MGSACCLALNTPFLRLLQSRGVESGAWMPLELAANCRWLRAAGWLQAEAGLERAPSPPLHTVPPGLQDFPIQPLHKTRRSHFIKGFSVSAMLNILKRCPVRWDYQVIVFSMVYSFKSLKTKAQKNRWWQKWKHFLCGALCRCPIYVYSVNSPKIRTPFR